MTIASSTDFSQLQFECRTGARSSTIAYFANQFPSEVEPYVLAEIEELRRRGLRIIAGSVRRPDARLGQPYTTESAPEIVLHPLRIGLLLRAAGLCARRWKRITDLVGRVILRGGESPMQRLKALMHTWLGAYYALLLKDRGVKHIHVHHGYFGSWIAMTAARLLDVGFSMTLHGSDVLLHSAYLDVKLRSCGFCLTVSEYNRQYILEHYPAVPPQKVLVARMGVDVPDSAGVDPLGDTATHGQGQGLKVLAVGRLHAVKDHAFLIRACAQLRAGGLNFHCSIAGEGPERHNLEALIRRYGLQEHVALLGHVPREQMDTFYARAHVVVLTSRSEGIPLVLMEAMARGKIVLAPAVTGIPE